MHEPNLSKNPYFLLSLFVLFYELFSIVKTAKFSVLRIEKKGVPHIHS